MKFRHFAEFATCDDYLNDIAEYIVKEEIDPQTINELAELYREQEQILLEFNPFKLATGMFGGATGAALGGPVGAPLGAAAGNWLANKVGGWFKKQQAPQVTPAFQQAKQAADNLVQSLSGVANAAGGSQELKTLTGSAKQVADILKQSEPAVQSLDQGLNQQHVAQAREKGGIAQKVGQYSPWLGKQLGKIDTLNQQGGVRRALANTGDKMSAWAQRNPRLAQLAALGTASALAGGLYGAGGALGQALGHGANVHHGAAAAAPDHVAADHGATPVDHGATPVDHGGVTNQFHTNTAHYAPPAPGVPPNMAAYGPGTYTTHADGSQHYTADDAAIHPALATRSVPENPYISHPTPEPQHPTPEPQHPTPDNPYISHTPTAASGSESPYAQLNQPTAVINPSNFNQEQLAWLQSHPNEVPPSVAKYFDPGRQIDPESWKFWAPRLMQHPDERGIVPDPDTPNLWHNAGTDWQKYYPVHPNPENPYIHHPTPESPIRVHHKEPTSDALAAPETMPKDYQPPPNSPEARQIADLQHQMAQSDAARADLRHDIDTTDNGMPKTPEEWDKFNAFQTAREQHFKDYMASHPGANPTVAHIKADRDFLHHMRGAQHSSDTVTGPGGSRSVTNRDSGNIHWRNYQP